jgi:hypothetical protein
LSKKRDKMRGTKWWQEWFFEWYDCSFCVADNNRLWLFEFCLC